MASQAQGDADSTRARAASGTAVPVTGGDALAGAGSSADAAVASSGEAFDLSAEVESILADTTMPIAEKQTRLQELSDRFGVTVLGGTDGDEASPLELQIAEALGMLAEGGHGYGPEDETPEAEAAADIVESETSRRGGDTR